MNNKKDDDWAWDGGSEHPLLEGIGQFCPLGEQGLELLLLLLHPTLPFLVVHIGVGSLPDGIFGEEDASGQFNLILKSLPFSCLFLTFLRLVGLLVIGLLPEVILVLVLHIIVELFPARVFLRLGVVLWRVEVIVLIVIAFQFLVREDVVGLLHFCELGMALRVQIGVQFFDQFEIGAFDGVFTCSAFDLQDTVVVLVEVDAFEKGVGLAEVGTVEVDDSGSSHQQQYQESEKYYSDRGWATIQSVQRLLIIVVRSRALGGLFNV